MYISYETYEIATSQTAWYKRSGSFLYTLHSFLLQTLSKQQALRWFECVTIYILRLHTVD